MALTFKIAVLAGDGIGPEVMAEAIAVLQRCAELEEFRVDLSESLVGGVAIDETGKALPEDTLANCEQSDAILFGSVGGPKWERLPPNQQPERAALLPLRKHFNLFANLRPALCLPELSAASPLRSDLVQGGFEILCIRELTGGLYFGQPKGTHEERGETIAIDTMVYRKSEVERIAHLAFQIAQSRKRKLVSVDKANVLENSLLWRSVIKEIASIYPDVAVTHLLVDNAAMQFIRAPKTFDVVVTENLFGDILSDESGGSAPDIAGMGIANPIAQVLSVAMMLRYSFGRNDSAARIESAVSKTIKEGFRTKDIQSEGTHLVSTKQMGSQIRANLDR
jgi:3-isopropylmalate dehydrogenase